MAFPSSPANGTIYTNSEGNRYEYITDNNAWRKYKPSNTEVSYLDTNVDVLPSAEAEIAKANLGIEPNTQHGPGLVTVHETSGTHTYQLATKFAMVYAVGGGGGGAGANSVVTDASSASTGGGGVGGGTAMKLIDVANQNIKTATITIGAGGTFGQQDQVAPTAGGNTIYSDGVYAFAGQGGTLGGSAGQIGNKFLRDGADPVAATQSANCDLSIYSKLHFQGFSAGVTGNPGGGNIESLGGSGGNSLFGAGYGRLRRVRSTTALSNNVSEAEARPGAQGYGYGGGGAASIYGSSANGSNGGSGVVIIMEYQ